jgi:hypothetical protein
MKIIKHISPEKHRSYINMNTHILLNRSTSLSERGLLLTLLNLPPDWDFSVAGICKLTKNGPAAVRSCLARLKANGYVEIKPQRSRNGCFMKSILHVYDVPKTPGRGNPSAIPPFTEKPDAGK